MSGKLSSSDQHKETEQLCVFTITALCCVVRAAKHLGE